MPTDNNDLQLAIHEKETELRRQQNEQQFEFALKSLELQKSVLETQKNWMHDLLKSCISYLKLFTFLFFIIVGIAMFLNKEQFVYEMVKISVPLIIGWIGGYSWKSRNGQNESIDSLKRL